MMKRETRGPPLLAVGSGRPFGAPQREKLAGHPQGVFFFTNYRVVCPLVERGESRFNPHRVWRPTVPTDRDLFREHVRNASPLDQVIPALTGSPLSDRLVGGEHRTRCPFHDDKRPSLRINLVK